MLSHDPTPVFLQHLLRAEARLYAYIRSQIPGRADAEDVLQETVTVLWSKFADFEPGTDFLACAYQVAPYKVAVFHRQNKKREFGFSPEFLEAIADRAESMSDELSDVRDALAGCLKRLRSIDREVVERCYGTDATIAAVAEELGRPLTTVKSILRRSRRKLFDCIQRKMREG